jgi:hypothetical protein
MAKSISTQCSECGEKFRVTSASAEPVVYCPFCGGGPLPTDDDVDDDCRDDGGGCVEFGSDEDDE